MIKQSALLLLLLAILLSFQCRKNKNGDPADQLPPETQTGAGTFGCMVNGKLFQPKGSPFGGPVLSCAYQYIDGGYYFQLKARQDVENGLLSIGIFTDSLAISQGKTIRLFEQFNSGKAYALHGRYISGTPGNLYSTGSSGTGELHITKFDETARIVSGTFWFDAVNENGEKVEVRQGRFDVQYTL